MRRGAEYLREGLYMRIRSGIMMSVQLVMRYLDYNLDSTPGKAALHTLERIVSHARRSGAVVRSRMMRDS
jgi:hypothetical protein